MIASFHCIEYRRPVISPPRRMAEVGAKPRFWRPLNIGGDFAWYREHPTRRALYPRLRPDFRRWAFFAVWDDETALEEFLERSHVGRAWQERAREAWHLWLRPLRVRGAWEGTRLLRDAVAKTAVEGPVAEIVRLDLSLRGTLAMWGWAAPRILAHLPANDDLLLGIPLVDRPYTQPVSFSLWRTAACAHAFAYRDSGHRHAVDRVGRAQPDLFERYSAARFQPYRSRGTWRGRDPLSAYKNPAIHTDSGHLRTEDGS